MNLRAFVHMCVVSPFEVVGHKLEIVINLDRHLYHKILSKLLELLKGYDSWSLQIEVGEPLRNLSGLSPACEVATRFDCT